MQISGQDSIRYFEQRLLNISEASSPVGQPAGPSNVQSAAGQDRVDISTRGKDSQSLLQAIAALPDVRADRVEQLRQQVESGQYQADSQKSAAGMVRSALMDTLL